MPSPDPTPRRLPVLEVAVSEDLDAWSAERIHHALQKALAARPDVLIIDLTRCPSMDEAGVALVLDTHRRGAQIDVTVALRSPSTCLQTALERTHGQVLQVIDAMASGQAWR